jgi:hypothetical protein
MESPCPRRKSKPLPWAGFRIKQLESQKEQTCGMLVPKKQFYTKPFPTAKPETHNCFANWAYNKFVQKSRGGYPILQFYAYSKIDISAKVK